MGFNVFGSIRSQSHEWLLIHFSVLKFWIFKSQFFNSTLFIDSVGTLPQHHLNVTAVPDPQSLICLPLCVWVMRHMQKKHGCSIFPKHNPYANICWNIVFSCKSTGMCWMKEWSYCEFLKFYTLIQCRWSFTLLMQVKSYNWSKHIMYFWYYSLSVKGMSWYEHCTSTDLSRFIIPRWRNELPLDTPPVRVTLTCLIAMMSLLARLLTHTCRNLHCKWVGMTCVLYKSYTFKKCYFVYCWFDAMCWTQGRKNLPD